ncbi:MAG: hypothetical protein H6Q64_2287, partial [Firmicutes bacterium]|nr:hypothetical protein [Bacillota bacterium]
MSDIEATIIIPTFGRADFIIWALKSVQQQTITGIEIFVIGDGASPVTKDIVAGEASHDSRIRFFDHPKGERNGERYRHQAIIQSKGKIICYLGHDDLWFPEHVESMLLLLKDADFGHSMHTYISVDGTIQGCLPLISDPLCRSRMLQHYWNRFGPTCSAHTRNIYFGLPYGWRPAPLDIWSDLYMWRQFIIHPGCRFTGLLKTTTISFPRSFRYEYSVEQRAAELAGWFPRLSLPDEAQKLSVMAIQGAAGDLQREIIRLENIAHERLVKSPISQSPRPSVVSLLWGRLYVYFNKLTPGNLTVFKDRILEKIIAGSGLFDRQFYLERYLKDLSSENFNPIRHYLGAGWKNGANPSPDFNAV